MVLSVKSGFLAVGIGKNAIFHQKVVNFVQKVCPKSVQVGPGRTQTAIGFCKVFCDFCLKYKGNLFKIVPGPLYYIEPPPQRGKYL
jgi:hypothetical protein